MKLKYIFSCILAAVISLILLAGCGSTKPSASADLSVTQTDISLISVPSDAQVVGLGEASHGVQQYQEMKLEVFKVLVENNGCRTFIIEGDFGGALKVDQYINGGSGTAEDAVREIGFAIYRTQEMTDLVEWMRAYNETVSKEEALHFYGMDTQRFDNNKEYLFSILDESDAKLSAAYQEAFEELTDEFRTSLDKDTLNRGKESATELLKELDTRENEITQKLGQTAFEQAKECVNTIYACCDILLSKNYNQTRDQYMFEKVQWFLQHGDGGTLFINGHNGHIGKKSVAGYESLGELLNDSLGEKYYAIGTDAMDTSFNSQIDSGRFEVVEVSNANDLNGQLVNSDENMFYVDFENAEADEDWKQIIESEQRFITLNVSLSGLQKMMKSAYTTVFIPEEVFDGMLVFKEVIPTTLLK